MSTVNAFALPENASSTRLVLAWQIDDDHVLKISVDGRTGDGRIRYSYRLSRCDQTIFQGHDFCSGAGAEPTSGALTHAASCLLGFLTLCPGDVEADYFDEYTRAQIAWRDEFAEELSLYAQDRCCGYCGGEHDSPAHSLTDHATGEGTPMASNSPMRPTARTCSGATTQ